MKRIDVITVGRSDYGIYRPILSLLEKDATFDLRLIVSGAHLDSQTRISAADIEADNYRVEARIPLPEIGKNPVDITAAMGAAITGLALTYRETLPDWVMVLGDRYEMFALAAAVVPLNIPIIHVHGGELSFGAIDDSFRHAITKMSHLHFAATDAYAKRIVRLGEEPWRVSVSGAPGLDTLRKRVLPDRTTLEQRFNLDLSEPPILCTFHPVTRQIKNIAQQVDAVFTSLANRIEPVVLTAPNLDMGHEIIRNACAELLSTKSNASLVENFGLDNYLAMLREAAACVGNSSSGLIETPLFELPTLNIGDRQNGRIRAANVIDVECEAGQIAKGIDRLMDPAFRANLVGMENPYGDGYAAERIIEKIKSSHIDDRLIAKTFYDGEIKI